VNKILKAISMKKLILSIPVITLLSLTAKAQSLAPTTLNATGGTAIIGANEFDWSVGEMTMVSTFTASSIVVTQGVLQPAEMATTRITEGNQPALLSVFPNPSSSIVNINCTSTVPATLEYRLMDMTGKTLLTSTRVTKTGLSAEQLNISQFACATYALAVTVTTEQGTKTTTYKIEKLK